MRGEAVVTTAERPRVTVVIVCWNDREVLLPCLRSLGCNSADVALEIVVCDNGSTDGSVQAVRTHFPEVRVVELGRNLGLSRANNAGVAAARGDYVLILNPDTLVHPGALAPWVEFADRHPEAGAFGCRILNPDGSLQADVSSPFPTVWRWLVGALGLGWLGRFVPLFRFHTYPGWRARDVREVDVHKGCALLVRRAVLEKLGGFDEAFFYAFEETDLCYRMRKAGWSILFFPGAEVTHLEGQSVGRFPMRFEIERYRSMYRYFYKHHGVRGARRIRRVALLHLGLRLAIFGALRRIRQGAVSDSRWARYRAAWAWNRAVDPVKFVVEGREPELDGIHAGSPRPDVRSLIE